MNGVAQLLFNIALYIVGGFLLVYIVYYKIFLFFFKTHHHPKPHPKLFSLENRLVNGKVDLKFSVPETMEIKLLITRKDSVLKILKDEVFDEGIYEVTFNTQDLGDGDYILSLQSDLTHLQRSFTIQNNP